MFYLPKHEAKYYDNAPNRHKQFKWHIVEVHVILLRYGVKFLKGQVTSHEINDFLALPRPCHSWSHEIPPSLV